MYSLNASPFNGFLIAFCFTLLGQTGQMSPQSRQTYSQSLQPLYNARERNSDSTDNATEEHILFRGTSALHRPCDYILYNILALPLQQFEYGNARRDGSRFEITDKYLSVFNNATYRVLGTQFTVGDLVCDTRGHPIGFQTPLYCSNVTKRCECLDLNDLHTEQPFGVVGCLGIKGSYCIPGTLDCGFGYDCIHEKCEGIGHELKPNYLVTILIATILYLMYNLILY